MEHEISGLQLSAPPVMQQNHYQTLNVPFGASKMAIREAYLRLKNSFNGDNSALYSLMGADDVNAQLEQIELAFRILNDEFSRIDYDRQITGRSNGAEAASSDETTGWDHRPTMGHGGAQVITTSRSTLAVIKTVCEGSKNNSAHDTVQSMIGEGDLGDGELFRRIRETLGVSENEMQERTKISLEYLRAFESNRFDRLPQVVYVKGFLRSYFRYLGVENFEPMVKAFAARLDAWQNAKKR
jgi:DnaJ-class molecular chaperone